MGFIPEMHSEHGHYSVEVRSSSFYLRGDEQQKIFLYPDSKDSYTGTTEFDLQGIEDLRACLDLVEGHHVSGQGDTYRYDGVVSHYEVLATAEDGGRKVLDVVRTLAQAQTNVEALRFAGVIDAEIKPVMLHQSATTTDALLHQKRLQQEQALTKAQATFDTIVYAFVSDRPITIVDDGVSFTGLVSSLNKENKTFGIANFNQLFSAEDVELAPQA